MMPSSPKASVYLSRYISAKQTLQNADAVAGEDVVSRYQVFNLSGFDYKGQLSCAYGISGGEGKLGVELNVLDMLAPLFPIAELKVVGDTSLALEKESLLVLHRFPEAVYPTRAIMIDSHRMPIQKSQYPSQITPLTSAWNTVNPLSLLHFRGHGGEVAFKITLQAGVNLGLMSFIDELGFELSVVAKGSLELKGSLKRLSAPYVSCYPSPSDTHAAEASRLETMIDHLLNQPDRQSLKAEVEEWINFMVQDWLNAHSNTATPQTRAEVRSKRSRAKEKVWGYLSQAKQVVSRLPVADITTTIENSINDVLLSKLNAELRLPVFHTWLDNWLKTSSTTGLLIQLRTLQENIRVSNASPAVKEAAWLQAQRYEELLLRFYRRYQSGQSPAKPLEVRDYLSHFKMFAFCTTAQVGVSAGVSADPLARYIPVSSGIELKLQGAADAGAEATGSGQFISYRYQAINDAGKGALVYTQDTWLAYRRWAASAEALARAGFGGYEYEKQVGAQKHHYALSYTSSAIFWEYQQVHQDEQGYYTYAQSGSGICKGMSVSTKRLVDLARGVARPGLQRAISEQLAISPAQLTEFLQASEIGAIDPVQDGLPANVFLEVGFALSGNQRVGLRQKQRGRNPTTAVFDVTGQYEDRGLRMKEAGTPEWIRIRFRLADVDKSKEPIFKLGFPVVLPRINIDTSRIKGAGQDALFDYYAHWFNNPEYNTIPRLAWWAQELSVPPVVFLHQ